MYRAKRHKSFAALGLAMLATAGSAATWTAGLHDALDTAAATGLGLLAGPVNALADALSLGQTVALPVSLAVAATCLVAVGGGIAASVRFRRRAAPSRAGRPTETVVRHIIEHRILGIVTISGRGMVGAMNPAAQVMLGYGASDLSGTHVRHLLPQLFRGGDDKSLETALNVDGGAFETHAVRHGGGKIPVEVTVTRLPVEGPRQYSAFVRDLTVSRNQQRLLEHQALHDSLTGLPNRTHFMRRLAEAIESAPPRRRRAGIAVLLLDLDRFKEVNNTLGHAVGDRALLTLSERLAEALPDGAVLARLGGDEFAVLLPCGKVSSEAEAMAARLRAALEDSLDIDSIRLELDGSVGIALWPQHADGATELMQHADIAMYAAKQTTTRIAVYDAAQDESSLQRLTLSGDLRRAVADGQLYLRYQPKVDLKTRQLRGVEALVRWRHPEYGAVPPDEFIGHAEATGTILPLSAWVLSTAVAQCASWHADGLKIDVAVNISAKLLLGSDLVMQVEAALARTGLPPRHLVLEVTESALMADPERAQATLAALKRLGVRLAIDDFGTGYSSLAYLSDLNADELKIDQRFVRHAVENASDRTIVRSTIDLAHNLGLEVVAEGMEDERACRLLRRLGCETGQGYYFARPLSEQDVVAWAQKRANGRPGRKPRKAVRAPGGKCAARGRDVAASARKRTGSCD